MKCLAILALALCCGAVYAQNPTIAVTAQGGQAVAFNGTINMVTGSTLNSADIDINVGHPTAGTPVSISASITNLGAAVNWSTVEFSRAATPTPYQHEVLSPTGTFGAAGTVHVVTLTVSDGTNSAQWQFSISVNASGGGGGGGGGSDGGGGGCAAGAPAMPLALVMAGGLVAWRRRRRKT
ncbi:MAG: hypothetical protein IPK87_12700 [Planctomycetes bacterium]|nr:hypothetical protein [Planctomycetota bacterium]